MHTYGEIVRTRLSEAAAAAGFPDECERDVSDMPVSSIIRNARRFGVSISSILDEPLGVTGDLRCGRAQRGSE